MDTRRCLLMTAILASLVARAWASPSPVEQAVEEMASSLDALLTESGFQGAFLIALEDRVLHARGYGFADRAGEIPTTPTTAFWTASVAKSFTAAAIMRLVDLEKLGLTDRVADHLPGTPEGWETMTIHHLLSHTSGIEQNYAADGHRDREDALQAIYSAPLGSPPGEGWHYSNDAYSVLAILVEMVSGRAFEEFVRAELFDPAGLTHSGFWADPPGQLAELQDLDRDREPDWGYRGGSGIASSARDLHRWWLALRAGRVLREKTVRTMMAPRSSVREGLSTGYGWFQEATAGGHAIIWARGTDSSGENAALYALPEVGLVIIGLSHHEGDRDPITRRMALTAISRFEAALAR